MKLSKITPILRSFDESKAKEFYLEFLEFNLDWEHRFKEDLPLYMQISKEDCVLHISEHHGDCSPGAAIRIGTDDLEEYHQRLLEKKYQYARPAIQDMPWGGKDMVISDPFGNRIIFTGAINER
ncbi:MAG: VOC family protein [Pseudomonadales bacterium]|nr:VOC family protein [Pseudomonadales bacterium]